MVNCCIGEALDFHDTLCGFRSGRLMGTTDLKVNLLHKLTVMRKEVLYEVLLDPLKSYEALD